MPAVNHIYAIVGWDNPPVSIGSFCGGAHHAAQYIHVTGEEEAPSIPAINSRAKVYRWLADLEDRWPGYVDDVMDDLLVRGGLG